MGNNGINVIDAKLYEKRQGLVRKYIKGVLKEMALGNQELVDFFDEFEVYVTDKSVQKTDEYMAQAKEIIKQLSSKVLQKRELEASLKKMGVDLSNPVPFNLPIGNIKTKDGNQDSFEIFEAFNGAKLTKELLTEQGFQKLKEDYEKARNNNAPYNVELERINRVIEQDEKKLKHTFRTKKKEELTDEIQDQTERLNFIKARKKEEEKMQKLVEVLEGLGPEQRREIKKYLEVSEQLTATYKTIDAFKKKLALHKLSKYNKEAVPEAFVEMVEKKGLTDEDVTSIFEMMKQVEKKADGGTYRNPIINKKDIEMDKKYKQIAEAFLQYIYEPEKPIAEQEYFVKRKEKSKSQEEPEGEEH